MQIQVADVFRLAREQFPLILDDLGSMSGPVVAEGSALLPELLASNAVGADRARPMNRGPDHRETARMIRPSLRLRRAVAGKRSPTG